MSRLNFELFSNIAGNVMVIVDVLFFYAMWNIFYKKAKEKTTIIAGIILLFINIGLGLIPYEETSGRLLVSAIVILIYSFIRQKKHCEKTMFILTLFYGFRSLDFLISNSIYQYLCDSLYERLDIESEYYLNNLYLYSTYNYVIFYGIYIVILLMMLLVLRKTIVSFNKMNWYEVGFLSVLNIIGGFLTKIIVNISLIKLENDIFDLFTVKKELLWKLPFIAVLLFLGEITAIIIYQKYIGLQKEKEKHFVEQQQIKAMKKRLEEAENFYGSIRKVRHEMKNHMTNIKGLVATEQYAEVDSYIEKLDETIEELDYKYTTGNAVTDVIINDKYKKAEKENIQFDVQFVYQESDIIPVFDMGIILSNLLDNAIEACQKTNRDMRYIKLSMKRKNNFLLLEVENSFDGILKTEKDGFPQTKKEADLPEILMEHGVGLRNVKEIAERYLGTMDIKVKGNVFKVTVMLQK